MRVELSKSFMDRLKKVVEDDERNQEERMSGQDAEGSKSANIIKKPVQEAAGGKGKDKEEDMLDEKKEEKGEGKKRRWNSDIKFSERYNEDDADITIISSDGIAFRVHSLLLTRAS
jgi:hypothetical protein